MEKITVVTICYNAEREIADTMNSVYQQDYNNIEYIIVDGASKDNTLEIIGATIKKDSPNVTTKVISEKDKGIYDAMNKGIALASGEWILFMNAGDLFYSSKAISEAFQKEYDKEVKGIFGDTERFCGEYKKLVAARPLEDIKGSIPLPFCHQSVFVRTDIMKKLGFDTQYKQAADYHFFLQCFLNGYKFQHVNVIISRYSMGGISESNTVFHLSEKLSIREGLGVEHYSFIKKNYMIQKLRLKQMIKRWMPRRLLEKVRGY